MEYKGYILDLPANTRKQRPMYGTPLRSSIQVRVYSDLWEREVTIKSFPFYLFETEGKDKALSKAKEYVDQREVKVEKVRRTMIDKIYNMANSI